MFYRFVFFTSVLIVSILWIDILNPGLVKVTLPGYPAYVVVEPSKMALMLGSAGFGALVVFFGISVKATGEFFRNWKSSREQLKDAKLHALYSNGVNEILSRRNDLAASCFQKVLAMDPAHVDSLLRLGNIHHKNGDYTEAIRLHLRAHNLDEDNIEVLFALALDYEDSRRTEDALQTLEDVLEKDEDNLRAITRIRDIRQRTGEFEKAEEAQQRVLKLSLPEKERQAEQHRLVGLKYETGRAFLEVGSLDKAKRSFKAVLKIDKDFVPAYLGLGEVLIEEDDTAEAASLWEDAYKNTGSIILLHRLEDLYLKLSNPVKIINLYKEAVARTPKNVNLTFFLGKLYYRLEMVDEAFDILSAIDSSTSQLTDLHKLLGNLYLRQGNQAKASEEFKKALAFSDQHIVPYRCGNCEHFSPEWSGRCPRCGKWNTFGIDLDKYC